MDGIAERLVGIPGQRFRYHVSNSLSGISSAFLSFLLCLSISMKGKEERYRVCALEFPWRDTGEKNVRL